jgi:sigma-B regulation protein RsbU (phosphoserine phosphatase)
MKNSSNIPANLRTNLKNSLDFYKNIFNYKNILLLHFNVENVSVLIQTNKKKYSKFNYNNKTLKIKDSVYKRKNLSKRSVLFSLCNHFNVDILFRINKNNMFAIQTDGSDTIEQEIKLGRFFSEYLDNLLQSEKLVIDLETNSRRLRQMISEITTLHEITRALDSGQNLDALLYYIMEKCKLIMNAEATSLMLVIPETQELEFKIVLGPKSEEVRPFRLPIGKGISGWVAKTGKPVLIPDAYKDDRFDPSFDKRSGFVTRSMLCVPMIYKNKIIGVMTVLNRLDQFSFTENDQVLLTIFASQAALAIENAKLLLEVIEKERLQKELQVAAEIQKLLIPQKLPKIKNLDISATYLPCQEISGDFYDIIPLKNKRYAFIVADVSGKGIPGAMVVSNMQATLRAYLEQNDNLLNIVSKLNHCIIGQTTDDRYITFFIGIYDELKMTLEYVNAGHNPPLIYRKNKKIDKLKIGGIFIGFLPFEYQSEMVQLKSGDIFLLYTDGLVEAMNEKEEEFEEKSVIKIIKQNANTNSKTIQNALIEGVKKHIGDKKLEDDFTLVITKLK